MHSFLWKREATTCSMCTILMTVLLVYVFINICLTSRLPRHFPRDLGTWKRLFEGTRLHHGIHSGSASTIVHIRFALDIGILLCGAR